MAIDILGKTLTDLGLHTEMVHFKTEIRKAIIKYELKKNPLY